MRWTSIVFRYALRHDTTQWSERLYEEILSWIEGSLAYPSYPRRATFSYISLQTLANRLHEKQRLGSVRRVTRLEESPFCDGRDTLLAEPTVLQITTLSRSPGPSFLGDFPPKKWDLNICRPTSEDTALLLPRLCYLQRSTKAIFSSLQNHDSSAIVTKVTLSFLIVII